VIDVVRTAFQKKGNLSQEHIHRVAYGSGVSASAINGWLFGDVRRPWSLNTRFVLEELGVTIAYKFDDGTSMDAPEPKLISKAKQNEMLKEDERREAERNKKRKAKSKSKKGR
jgi:transcriptional regulator with XRE-family HTH domain